MKNRAIIFAMLISSIGLSSSAVFADSEDEAEQNAPVESQGITSIEAQTIGKKNVRALASAAEYCVAQEQYDQAIKLSRMALDKDYDDNELHQVYAEALEGKLQEQVNKDPEMLAQCVKEWLVVLRQEYGDEKLTYHGLGIPILGKFYEDEDRVIPARKHLMKLVGSAPKVWETDAKYLKRVLRDSTTKVSGKVISDRAKRDHSAPEDN